ncbi:MAG TPA: AI-2E family transporter [Paracoccaceae bacterium]|nr:AI-2E family transporter [Paracoccaceae bacterium]
MSQPDPARQRVITLSVDVFVTLLIVAAFLFYSFRLVAPFVPMLIWAVILAVAIAPVHAWLAGRLGGGGRAALAIGTLGLLLVFGPTVVVVREVIASFGELSALLSDGDLRVPPPPEGVADWPLLGRALEAQWTAANENLREFSSRYAEEIRSVSGRLLGVGGGLLAGVLQFALSVIFAAVFLANGPALAGWLDRIAARVSARGRVMMEMGVRTVRNVSRGVLGVAIVQGGLGAVGIVAAGLPFAGFLAAALVMSCVVQVPALIVLPLIGYAWWAEPTLYAALFTAYMIPVMLIDNVLKPMLMARGLTTPMPVILLGVIGGTLTGGLVGLFVGPVVLALFYEMLESWLDYDRDPATGAAADEAVPGG